MHPPIPDSGPTLITLGLIMLLGLASDYVGRKTRLPRVSLLFLVGFLAGPAVLDWLPPFTEQWFPLVTTVALVLVGFLLGGKLADSTEGQSKKEILGYSIGITLLTAFFLVCGLLLLGVPPITTLLLAGIATATDPATTLESIKGYQDPPLFVKILEGIVSLDDALALIIFSILLIVAHVINNSGGGILNVMLATSWEVVGAALLGIVLGVPMAYLTGRLRAGEPTLVEALGVVLLCGGLSVYLNVSYLVASVVLGYVVARWARHHTRAFHEIEDIEWPFIILFFVLTGASVRLDMLSTGAGLIAAYVVLRILGRVLGGLLTGYVLGSQPHIRNWLGLCLLPQAGVATGLALLASTQFPEEGKTIVSVVVVATIIFELFGPVITRVGLRQASRQNQLLSR